jgi:membrane-associated phospholipid phosphatase
MIAVLVFGLLDASAQAPVEPRAGTWRPWVLATGSESRLPAPPDAQATADELRQLHALVARRDAATLDRIRYWDFWSPAHRWNEIATDAGIAANLGTAPGFRTFAMLNVAMHDATIAAWDAKYAHNRRRPGDADRTLTTAVTAPVSPSYPCEHSVAAGAASAVLAHVFPKDAARFLEAAEEASRSRVTAGVVYPSDAKAGLELGRAVAARVIERVKLDGAKWSGTVPTGPGLWKGADPVGVDHVAWKPFLLTSASQFRASPPPAPESPERAAEIAEVKSFKRTPMTNSRGSYWQFGQYGQAGWHYMLSREIGQRLAEQGLERNAPRATRAYALVAVASYDAYIASQDTKFHYWTARPSQFDPAIATVVPNPPFPSYPSNAAAVGMAPALVMAHLFPREAARYRGWAQEFGESRLWAGIHFKSDIDAGFEMGRRVGALAIERAKSDGGN